MEAIVEVGDKELKKRSMARAGHKCELCNSTYMLDNHHLLPKSIYPQWRFEPMNTAILCRKKCHNMAENHPWEFAAAIEDLPHFHERLMWVSDNKGIGKYPSEVDYEEMYNELMESEL